MKVGDRVVRKDTNQYAVVLEIKDDAALVHWGTEYGVKFTSWVRVSKLTLV